MKTFEELAQKMGKKLPTKARFRTFRSTEDRPKVFPTDETAPQWAGHPDGEITGYVQRFCMDNHLKL